MQLKAPHRQQADHSKSSCSLLSASPEQQTHFDTRWNSVSGPWSSFPAEHDTESLREPFSAERSVFHAGVALWLFLSCFGLRCVLCPSLVSSAPLSAGVGASGFIWALELEVDQLEFVSSLSWGFCAGSSTPGRAVLLDRIKDSKPVTIFQNENMENSLLNCKTASGSLLDVMCSTCVYPKGRPCSLAGSPSERGGWSSRFIASFGLMLLAAHHLAAVPPDGQRTEVIT